MERMHAQVKRWSSIDSIALLLLMVVGAAVRAARLNSPPFGIGDEGFYSSDACWYVFSSHDLCGIATEGNLEHPPLGKWLIGFGIKVLGYDTLGQRLAPVVFGILTIPLLYLLARRLLRSTLGASITAGLFAIDFLHLVHSRVAMLDIFLVFFVCLGAYFLLLDRDRRFGSATMFGEIRDPTGAFPARKPSHVWRYAAGAVAGAAFATKWSGIYLLAMVAFLSIAWDITSRRGPHERHPVLRSLREEGLSWAIAFVLLPLVMYALPFFGRIQGAFLVSPFDEAAWLNELWDRQVVSFRWHAEHIWAHHAASEPWNWPLAQRGVPFVPPPDADPARFVVSTGNPVVWTLSFVAVAFVALRWVRNRRVTEPEGFIMGGFAWAYLPWVLYYVAPYLWFTWGRAALFVWYLMPALPFMYLALGYSAVRVAPRLVGRIAIGAVALFAVAAFAFYYPVLTYLPLSQQAFDARMEPFDDCKRSYRSPLFFFKRVTAGTSVGFRKRRAPASHQVPPDGWCWL